MANKKVVVVGGNFAGLTGALELHALLGTDIDITVISKADHFVFTPSQIWVPFGLRKREDITFALDPVLDPRQIHFIHEAALGFDLEKKQVLLANRTVDYDYLLIATGPEQVYEAVPGLGTDAVQNIVSLPEAERAHEAWRAFVNDPGPVVIGATQGAACFGAAYEFLFNFAHAVRKARITRRAPITYVTSEPFLGHFGIGGMKHGEGMLKMFLKQLGIEAVVNTGMQSIDEGGIRLTDGQYLPAKYKMVIPPFRGAKAVFDTPGLGDAKGFIPVNNTYEHVDHPDVFAAGVAVQVAVPWQTPIATGVPKTGFPAEMMAKVAAHSIASKVKGEPVKPGKAFDELPAVCVMDAGNMGVIILGDHMLPPRKHEVLIPGPQAHWAKLAFEKYFIWKMKNGHVQLP